ncbi:hypothetical protein [Ammoniphilus resinae]|uniref:RNA:NAD 2'-phosphotransferase (TPT1/KptA family) n=1 Tax=Ammoniphilus resinae TaxID=861532 RepID=A0ABS4GKZ9_9BACL|nr:hypothetical protein [Ammoniphilus resinae]MBP1930822.1 RNA:NAD 2'-phosphotransferase (TPT1/KptA family) [Ammoniphilus resinae]
MNSKKLERRIRRFIEGELSALGLNSQRINNIQRAVNQMNSVQSNGQFLSNIQRNLTQVENNLRSMNLDSQTQADIQNLLNRVRTMLQSTDPATISRVVEEFRSNRFGGQNRSQWVDSIRSHMKKL